jgi:hypothetical protein
MLYTNKVINKQMKPKHILYGFLSLSFIFGYNYWLIQRDKVLFETYNQPSPQERFERDMMR